MGKRKKEKGAQTAESGRGGGIEYEVALEGVKKSYRKGSRTFTAADGVSLGIRRGEFFTFLGPEGSGKSTIMRLIAGLEVPDQGSILLEGRVVNDLPPEKRRIPMVFQDLALFPHLSVYDNISYGIKFQKPDAEAERVIVESALHRVGLQGYEKKHPEDLRPGEKQRLALARAVALRPKLILFDEPFFLLDTRMRRQLAYEIKRLQISLGITVVYGTSNVTEALAFSDRIALLDSGAVAQIGTPEDLYYRPAGRVTADFIGETNRLSAVIGKKKDEKRVFLVEGGKLEIPEGCLRPQHPGPLQEGRSVALYVKAEHIVPAKTPKGLKGRVTAKFFRGPHTVYALDVMGLAFHMWRPSLGGELSMGAEIPLSFKKDSVLVFDDAGEAAHV